jgi:hypothetical protein
MTNTMIDPTTDTTEIVEDWSKPAAMAIPKEGFFKLEQGRYGPIYPKTPANHGFTMIAKIKPGTEQTIREYGNKIESTIKGLPDGLAVLQLHYLRWALFTKYGINTVFENLEGFPMDWKTNTPAFLRFVREHQRPSFLEYGEYPYVSAEEIKKALRLKAAFSNMLDQMQ